MAGKTSSNRTWTPNINHSSCSLVPAQTIECHAPGSHLKLTTSIDVTPPPARDSVKIDLAAGLADTNGSASQMSFFIPVGDGPIREEGDIRLSLKKSITRNGTMLFGFLRQ